MRALPTDSHHRVWLLALSVAPILIRHDETLKADPSIGGRDSPADAAADPSGEISLTAAETTGPAHDLPASQD